jgi:hypothetical protein
MDANELRRIVEEVIAAVLRERPGLNPPPLPPSPPSRRAPLILLTGCRQSHPVIFRQLRRLQSDLGPAVAVLSESFCELVAPERFQQETGIADLSLELTGTEAESLAARSTFLLVATMSANSRNKIAAGITDSLPTTVWGAARRARLPLFVAEPSDPIAPPSAPDTPTERIRQREETMSILRNDGAEILPAAELFERIQRFLMQRGERRAGDRDPEKGPRPIITAEDVERAHRRGEKRWDLPADAIVTMAAHDRARDLGLDLCGGNLP